MKAWVPWWLHRWREAAGWPGAFAAAAWAAAAAAAFGLAPGWRAQAAALLQQPPRPDAAAAGMPSVMPRGHAPTLELPAREAAPARSAAVHALAARHGVTLLRSSERRDGSGALQLQMSARAAYPALRDFLAAALQADAALALDRVRLHRPSAEVAELEVELHWTLLQRADAAGAARRAR